MVLFSFDFISIFVFFVLSRFKFTRDFSLYMSKLNKRKLRWIVSEMDKRDLSVCQIAEQQGITKQWAYKIYARYKRDGFLPVPIKPGRTSLPVCSAEVDLVRSFKQEYGVGAVNLELIMKNQGYNLSHNRIHTVLKMCNLAEDEPNKKNKRKWVRYERTHSNSAWHTDWYEWQNLQIIAFLDDASRFITGVGIFDTATTENALLVLNQAIKDHGIPKELISDHGTQYTSNLFQNRLKELNIKHIKAKIKHPQTNGKIERWFQTLEKTTKHFGDINYALWFYNNKRPHMSLNKKNKPITPAQAYKNKKLIRRKNYEIQKE